MFLFLRGCILNQKKLFIQEVLFNRMAVFHKYNNEVKKFTNTQQMRYSSSDNNTNEDKDLIYEGILSKRIRSLKLVSLTTSCLSLTLLPLFLEKLGEADSAANVTALYVTISVTCMFTPFLIHQCSKRYVTELYHCPKEDKYIAIVYNLFTRKKEIEFTPKDVEPPKPKSTMVTTCLAKGFPLLFSEQQFKIRKHYFIIMGYNKPIDFEVEKVKVLPLNQPPPIDSSRQIESKMRDTQ